MGLSHQVWSHGGSTFKKMTLNGHLSRPAQTDPYDLRWHFPCWTPARQRTSGQIRNHTKQKYVQSVKKSTDSKGDDNKNARGGQKNHRP